MNLDIQQKLAIREFLCNISSSSQMEWDKNKLLAAFHDYELNNYGTLSYSEYVRTLARLPFIVKRDLICKILNSWSYAAKYDHYTLYRTLQDILYLKIETGVECVLFNNILNLYDYSDASSCYFKATVNDGGWYNIEAYYLLNNANLTDSLVHITTSCESEHARVQLNVPATLLHKKMQFTSRPSENDITDMLNQLTNNNTKRHCPWIYLDYSIDCTYIGPFVPFLKIEYNNIQYIDNNGE